VFGREFQSSGKLVPKKKYILWNDSDSRRAQSAATDARCDETAEVGRCRRAADLERQHG